MLRYMLGESLTVEEFRDLLVRSTLAERRPVDDRECLAGMLRHADILATCRVEGRLVGVARSVTDFSFCCYLSDLAVDATHQRQGIGRALIAHTRSLLGPRCKLILLAAPAAETYYPHLGFTHHPQAWLMDAGTPGAGNATPPAAPSGEPR